MTRNEFPGFGDLSESLDTLRERRDALRARYRALHNEQTEVHSRHLQSLYRRSVQQARNALNAESSSGDGVPALRADASSNPDQEEASSYVRIPNLLPQSSS